jgi:hypothetical protein
LGQGRLRNVGVWIGLLGSLISINSTLDLPVSFHGITDDICLFGFFEYSVFLGREDLEPLFNLNEILLNLRFLFNFERSLEHIDIVIS